MGKYQTSQGVSRLSLLLAILVPLVFLGVVILKNQKMPVGFEILKLGAIAMGIALAVWLSVRLTARLADILGKWLDEALAHLKHDRETTDDEEDRGTDTYRGEKIIDAEILEEENLFGDQDDASDKVTPDKITPDWAKPSPAEQAVAPSREKRSTRIKRRIKRLHRPASRATRSIVTLIGFAIGIGLIHAVMGSDWMPLLAPIAGLLTLLSLWHIWDPKNKPADKNG